VEHDGAETEEWGTAPGLDILRTQVP